MWKVFFDMVKEYSPTAIVIIALIGGVWFVAKFYFVRFCNIEKKLDSIPCTGHKNTLDTISQAIDAHTKTLEQHTETLNLHLQKLGQITDDLIQIKTYLSVKYPKASGMFSGKHSPRQLNESGKKILKDIDGEKFLADNADFLIGQIEKCNPPTALDVETKSNEILFENLNSPIFNNIKNWVYNSPAIKIETPEGEKDYAITMIDVCFILSIPLRDMYLNKHKELIS